MFKSLLKRKIVSIVRCQTKLSIFVAREVLRWKRYVAAARQCFENLSCKFANNCESQLCLAWERPTPPLNPILFYTVEQIKQGTTAGQEAKQTSSGIMSTPTDVQQQDGRPPGGGKEQQPPPLEQQHEQQLHRRGLCHKLLLLFVKYILNHNIVCTKLRWWIERATARAPTVLAKTRCCYRGTADTLSFM